MTKNTDKPKIQRNFSVSKNFSQVHTILDDIDKQERSRFICEAIIEKFNNMNKEQKSTEPMEQMKQMMEQYQMISSLINPVQQTMLNPAMVQMMQQPAYQQPIPNPAMLAQMQAQAFAQQVAQQVHTATPVQPMQTTSTAEATQEEQLQGVDNTERGNEKAANTDSVENTDLTIGKAEDDSSFKPQLLFKEDPPPIETEDDKEEEKDAEKEIASTEEPVKKSNPLTKEDKRLRERRRGGSSRQFM